jgi:hypothetical protein
MKRLEVGDKVRIVRHHEASDHQFNAILRSLRRGIVPKLIGSEAVVMDLSDSHGLCYEVATANRNGNAGRVEPLRCWVVPNEVEEGWK